MKLKLVSAPYIFGLFFQDMEETDALLMDRLSFFSPPLVSDDERSEVNHTARGV